MTPLTIISASTMFANSPESDQRPKVPHVVGLSDGSHIEIEATDPMTALTVARVVLKESFKIQIPTVSGWADYKYTSDDQGKYLTELFPTQDAAEKEIADVKTGIPDFEARVVPASQQADDDLYE